jgi:hypothetical protein
MARTVDAKAAVDDLIAADRAYSAEAAMADDIVAGLAAMLDTDAVMPVPGKGHAGRQGSRCRSAARQSIIPVGQGQLGTGPLEAFPLTVRRDSPTAFFS